MRRIVLFSLAVLVAVACDRSTPIGYEEPPSGLHSVAALKALCTGASQRIASDVSIRGVVTANDLYGEFYKTLVVEDDTGGIAIAVDCADLEPDFPLGCEVTVFCNGLTLTEYGGRVELGVASEGAGAGRIPESSVARHLRRTSTGLRPRRARVLALDEVGMEAVDTYVRFDGVRFVSPGDWCATDTESGAAVTTEHEIEDARGERFTVRVAATCVYAKEPLPAGNGSLCGIVDYFAGRYSLRVVGHQIIF